MATTYTLNATARNIIDALQAGKNILVHIVDDNNESYITPTYINFNTSSGNEDFEMSVPWGIMNSLSFSTSNLDTPLTYNSSGGVA